MRRRCLLSEIVCYKTSCVLQSIYKNTNKIEYSRNDYRNIDYINEAFKDPNDLIATKLIINNTLNYKAGDNDRIRGNTQVADNYYGEINSN